MSWKHVLGMFAGAGVVYVSIAITSGAHSLTSQANSAPPTHGAPNQGVSSKSASSLAPEVGRAKAPLPFWTIDDPVPEALADFSGTRLKAKFLAGADGSKVYLADVLYDSQLDVTCTYGIAMDDVERCLPTVAPEAADVWAQTCVCVKAPAGCTPNVPKYAYRADSPPPMCPPPDPRPKMHIFSVGALTTSPASCTGYPCYTIGAELPPSTFAQGTRGTDP